MKNKNLLIVLPAFLRKNNFHIVKVKIWFCFVSMIAQATKQNKNYFGRC